jgi:hypothetical protein
MTKQPEAVVRGLYRQVVARHPIGIPRGADLKALAPYLSEGLFRRLDLALSCECDYSRQHQDPDEKPEIEWLELGLFSGANEKALPAAFHLERTQPEKDGSFRVYVRLTYGKLESAPDWHVAVFVVREGGHFVVDDVVFLKEDVQDVEPPLSKLLTLGCDGSRWVGYGKPPRDFKK